MGHRYYCDYCDKRFIDDIGARKKHLSSVHHIKLRKQHYDAFRDLRTVFKAESEKTPCRRFLNNGFCQFDSNCKYTHCTQEQLWEMKQQILYEEQERLGKLFNDPEVPLVESWVEKYHEKKNLENDEFTSWSYPHDLEARLDLPQSLKKIEPKDFQDGDFEEWG